MRTVHPELGLLGVERDHCCAYARWQPASTFRPLPSKIDDWRSHVHLVQKAALPAAVCTELNLFLPEALTPPEHPLDRLMLQATPLAVVSEEVRAELLHCDVRVWTVGYHRNPALLHISALGGAQPPLWIEQVKEEFTVLDSSDSGSLRPQGRPPEMDWQGLGGDRDLLDRILRAASGGVLDEASILLARAIEQDGWRSLTQTRAARQAIRETIEFVRANQHEERAHAYESLLYDQASFFRDRPLPAPDAAHSAAVASLATESGPPDVEVSGMGRFYREVQPAVTLCIVRPHPNAGWLSSLSREGLVPAGEARLLLPAVHRYVQPRASGPWWDL